MSLENIDYKLEKFLRIYQYKFSEFLKISKFLIKTNFLNLKIFYKFYKFA